MSRSADNAGTAIKDGQPTPAALGFAKAGTIANYFPSSVIKGMLSAIGIAIGLAGAAALTRLMAAMLFGVNPLDWVTYVAVAVVLGATALLASYLPAARAARLIAASLISFAWAKPVISPDTPRRPKPFSVE